MSAIISQDEKYRYWLERDVRGWGYVYGYFGINPSTADAIIDDQTVKKWIGFTIRNGGGKFIVGNVFAYRTSKVKELAYVDDPIGKDNDFYINQVINKANILVPCWGNIHKTPAHLRKHFGMLLDKLIASGKPVKIFGKTKNGDPLHPMMLSYDTKLIDYES